MKICVFALTRGYEKLQLYNDLIERNLSLKKILLSENNINFNFEFILFHEGNIDNEQQKYIITKSKIKINFIDIKNEFKQKKLLKFLRLDRKFSHGYRSMCAFNYSGLWKYLNNYEYIMRVDEDIVFQQINYDKFLEFFKSDKSFLTIKLTNETHNLTNKTLPMYLAKIFGVKDLNFYNHKFPYTNFYILKTSFWLKPEIQKIVIKLSNSPLSYIFRWGDLPVIGCILNQFNKEIEILNNSEYIHKSHQTIIKS